MTPGSLRRGLALAALCAGPGCRGEGPPLPTLVLVTLDTTRADHLSTYGYPRRTDPFLAELARASRVFEVAVPSATWTLPSHVSLFSGLDPAEHGCWPKSGEVEAGIFPGVSPETPLMGRVVLEPAELERLDALSYGGASVGD